MIDQGEIEARATPERPATARGAMLTDILGALVTGEDTSIREDYEELLDEILPNEDETFRIIRGDEDLGEINRGGLPEEPPTPESPLIIKSVEGKGIRVSSLPGGRPNIRIAALLTELEAVTFAPRTRFPKIYRS